ncbi:MAG: hypothetical protein AUG74_23335 [Bacteroidetes bacterium 13_1_20CM_4_60_6]|nr:MAG: hypothetical protein AUG74_23335 [Bacteroidetes bacterium 13_1_20CM_4_60_6]
MLVGKLRRVIISNIVCSNAVAHLGSIISGIPGHEIEDVRLNDIYIQHQGGGTAADSQIQPPEKEDAYPEPTMFGPTLPSHGFFIRHARNIHLSNIEFAYLQEDARPAFVMQNVTGADFFRIKAQHAPSAATFALKQVQDFSVAQSRPVPDTLLDRADDKKL